MKRAAAIILALILLIGSAAADTLWVMCKGYVIVREKPGKKTEAGRLDAGDSFDTDGISKRGYIRAVGIGEAGDAWIFKGYVVDEEPEYVNARYVCVAKYRAACRRWINGPQIKGRAGWIYNGTSVKVYWRTDEWSVTSRGYIRSEWLDPDPE